MPDEQDDRQQGKAVPDADEALLKQIREDYRYCLDYWREIREEAATDMDYVAGNPWTEDDIEEREGRPCLTPDELSQYVKQANNNWRQSKRSIQVNPKGMGATDGDAKHRAAYIRGIEYQSNAQAAYTSAFEQMTECSMGFFRLTTQVTGERGEQEPRIKRIPNPFTVLMDPNAREADFSDSEICFVTDSIRKSKFAERYPKAQKRSFSPADANMAPDWINGENIMIAEYWKVERKTRKRMQVKGEAGATMVYEDELAKDDKPDVLNEWSIDERKVTQYITNGLEILETNEWAGSWIPIIGMFGEEIYVQSPGRTKRMFMSLIRRARASQKMLCFIASQEAEEFGMSPRTPFMIWEGQEQADPEGWKYLNKVPKAYIKIRPALDPQSGQLLPAPVRTPFIPNSQAYELAREAWRRAVQSSMGLMPLPTDAQRQNQKSGIALEKIQTQTAAGSYHFTDNAQRALENAGRQLNELITKIIDTPRQLAIRKPDDSHGLLQATTQQHGAPEGVEDDDYLVTDRGEFDVTISTGPSFQSEREQASDFVDTLLGEIGKMPIPPQVAQQILAKAIKLKDIGVLGDQIADLLAPPDPNDMPPQAQAAVAQAQGQAQQAMQKVGELTMERDAKVLENKHKFEIEQMKEAAADRRQQREIEAKILIAEIGTKAQIASDREKLTSDEMKQLHISAHEVGQQAADHAHEHSIADKQAEAAQIQQATQISADQQAQEQAQEQPAQ